MGHEGERQTCDECGQEFDAADLRESLYHLPHREDVPECRDAEGEPIRGVLLTTATPFNAGASVERRGLAAPEHGDQRLEVLRAMWVLAVRQLPGTSSPIRTLRSRACATFGPDDHGSREAPPAHRSCHRATRQGTCCA